MSIWDRVRELVFYGPRWMQIDQSKGAAERSLADQHLGDAEAERISAECARVDELNGEPTGTALSDRQSRLGLLGDERTVRDALRPFAERDERYERMDEAERQTEERQAAQRELHQLEGEEQRLEQWLADAEALADSDPYEREEVDRVRGELAQVHADMDEVRRDAGIVASPASTAPSPGDPAGPAGITPEDERIVREQLGQYGATALLEAVEQPTPDQVARDGTPEARGEHMLAAQEEIHGRDEHDADLDDGPEAGR